MHVWPCSVGLSSTEFSHMFSRSSIKFLHRTCVAQKEKATSLKNKFVLRANTLCWCDTFPCSSIIWSVALLLLENEWQTCLKTIQLHVWTHNLTPSHAQLYCSSAKFVICFPGHWLFNASHLCCLKANGKVHWKVILLYVQILLVDRM